MWDNSKPAMRARARYKKKAYDTVTFYPPKGWKERIKEYAYSHNMSLAGLIKEAVRDFIENNR